MKLDVALVGNEKQNEINIYMGGKNELITKGYSFGPYVRDFYQLEYCLGGELDIYCGEKRFKIREGDLYVLPPYTIARKEFIASSSSTLYIGFKSIKLAQYFKLLGFSDDNIVFPHKASALCKTYLENILSSLKICESLTINGPEDEHNVKFLPNEGISDKSEPEAELLQSAWFSLFLAELLHIRTGAVDIRSNKSVQQEYIDNAINYIETNYHQDISVDGVAKHVGIDRSYLFRLFREELGSSVHDYIIHVRMRAACHFLRQPGVQIKTVATSVGYEQFNFSKIFKRVIGISPSEYQKKHCVF